jgi:hypothetical protein
LTGDDWALRGSNPRPHGCDTSSLPSQPTIISTDTAPPSPVCTSVCTNNQEIAKTTDLDALAAELLALPKEERARHLAKLLGKGEAG